MHLLILGGSRDDRIRTALAHVGTPAAQPAAVVALDASTLPFVRPAASHLHAGRGRLVRIDDLERAFPNRQVGGTRLVLTQSTYSLQKWIDMLDADDRIVATADRAALGSSAPEALQARGPWAQFTIIEVERREKSLAAEDAEHAERKSVWPSAASASPGGEIDVLVRAYETGSTDERVRLCRLAAAAAPDSAVAALALASACRELQDMTAAREALDAAARLAPDWEAVHFEDGKFRLGYDDMEGARAAFQRACDLMPSFSSAFSNLGATLGELDRPDAALAAFRQALASDPGSFTILNNIGVVCREIGRLDESEAALRQVVEISPEFVFGHYNLGHTLFLGGQYAAALAVYEEGQRRDPEKNRRQGCRLALTRFANGDLAGAERDLWRFADAAPPDQREDLLLEAYEIAHALVGQHPGLAAHRAFLDRIAAEIARSSA